MASGDTGTCGVHLSGCEQLIRSARKRKTKYSGKARALHRIFFYLKTIHASTTLDKRRPSDSSRQPVVGLSDVSEQAEEPASEGVCDNDEWLEMHDSSPTDMTSCEYIYGVPQSLLILMRKAVRVVQLVARFRQQNPGVLYSSTLAQTCDETDEEILDWPIETELARSSVMSFGDAAASIVEHQTQAFHQAIILYFSQQVRLMHHRHLKPYVETVLYHMEEIERIKDDSKIFAGALFWPAFIAASEAFDPDLQLRFKSWFERAKIYGLHSLWSGNAIALEVWNKYSTNKTRVTSRWRAIAEEKQVELMLT